MTKIPKKERPLIETLNLNDNKNFDLKSINSKISASYAKKNADTGYNLIDIKLINNDKVSERNLQVIKEFKQKKQSVTKRYGFYIVDNKNKELINEIVNDGFKTRKTNTNHLGDSAFGIYICKNIDTMLSYFNDSPEHDFVICFLLEYNYTKPVLAMSQGEPSHDHNCQFSNGSLSNQSILNQYLNSMVFIYEYNNYDETILEYPRTVVPIALLTYERIKKLRSNKFYINHYKKGNALFKEPDIVEKPKVDQNQQEDQMIIEQKNDEIWPQIIVIETNTSVKPKKSILKAKVKPEDLPVELINDLKIIEKVKRNVRFDETANKKTEGTSLQILKKDFFPFSNLKKSILGSSPNLNAIKPLLKVQSKPFMTNLTLKPQLQQNLIQQKPVQEQPALTEKKPIPYGEFIMKKRLELEKKKEANNQENTVKETSLPLNDDNKIKDVSTPLISNVDATPIIQDNVKKIDEIVEQNIEYKNKEVEIFKETQSDDVFNDSIEEFTLNYTEPDDNENQQNNEKMDVDTNEQSNEIPYEDKKEEEDDNETGSDDDDGDDDTPIDFMNTDAMLLRMRSSDEMLEFMLNQYGDLTDKYARNVPIWRVLFEKTGKLGIKFRGESSLKIKLNDVRKGNMKFIDKKKTKLNINEITNKLILTYDEKRKNKSKIITNLNDENNKMDLDAYIKNEINSPENKLDENISRNNRKRPRDNSNDLNDSYSTTNNFFNSYSYQPQNSNSFINSLINNLKFENDLIPNETPPQQKETSSFSSANEIKIELSDEKIERLNKLEILKQKLLSKEQKTKMK